jgi:predicted component of type VI protein secretion system
MVPPQAAPPAPPRTAPQQSPVPAAPAGDATSRLRDGLVVAGFLAGVGALLAFFSGQAASQSVQSTGSHVLTYVGYGLVVLGVAAALFTAGRALGGRRP